MTEDAAGPPAAGAAAGSTSAPASTPTSTPTSTPSSTPGSTRTPGRRAPRPARGEKTPLYPRLLRLHHVHPNGWQRAVLGEGSFAVAAVLVLADRATAWTLVAFPAAVAGVVKAHDVLAGQLRRPPRDVPPAGA